MSIIGWSLDKWLDNVALAALSSKETLLATYDLARNVIERGIPGDFVECGVFGGAQCAVMTRAIMQASADGTDSVGCLYPGIPIAGHTAGCYPNKRRVHLFDSFEGVPAAGPHDTEWIAAGHPPGQSVCSLEGVKQHMDEWGIPEELLVYHPGWFNETIPAASDWPIAKVWPSHVLDRIALLRLDGDLYESTKVCMEHLYPLVSPGGWIIVDDFNLSGARKAFLESVSDTGPAYFQRHL